MSRGVGLIGLIVLLGCGGPETPDAGAPDAGGTDASMYRPPDAGPPGAAIDPTVSCDAIAADLYMTPAGLPPFTSALRGTLLGCALLESIDAAALRARLPSDVDVYGGVRVYLVAFRTATTTPDTEAISTAVVALPDVALSDTVPVVLAMHGSVGLPDACTPSGFLDDVPTWLRPSYVDAMFYAWAAHGLPVIAPDYPGLGTEGTHAYASWTEPARSGIDASRALRSMLPAARLASDTVVYGHSQGGGLALGVAAVANEAPDVSLSAVVSMAPGYRLLPLVEVFRLPDFPIGPAVLGAAALAGYSELAQLTSDRAEIASIFASPVRDHVMQAVETLCYGDLVGDLATPSAGYVPPTTAGELIDETFRLAAIACSDGGSCDGLSGAFAMRDAANEPHLSASSPPVLILASNDDEAVSPEYAGCVVERLAAESAPSEACFQDGPDHLGVVEQRTGYAIAWALAARAGIERPPCEGATRVARCPF
ncbi:MAG: alpha/beta hydrolase family protein [Sandaracinaceae bacterium]